MPASLKRVSVLCAAAVALAACDRPAPQRPDETRVVRVMTVSAPVTGRSVEFPGEIRARHESRLAFRVGGIIRQRLVDVGTAVQSGQPIAHLDATDLALAADSARAELATIEAERVLAEAEHARFKNLFESRFISQADYDRRVNALATAETRREAARARLRQAENLAGYAVLQSPVAGVVTAVEAEAGQVVAAAQTVARVAQPGEKEAAVAVPESERAFFASARTVAVTLNTAPGRTFMGRVRELSPDADPATRTYAARISLAGDTGGVALGMSVRVTASDPERDAGIALPPLAVQTRNDEAHVWLVEPDGTVRRRRVETGGLGTDRVLIRSGLSRGDVVVVAGAQLLRDGQKVRLLEAGTADARRP